MNSVKPSGNTPPDNRPRLMVVLPFLLFCLCVVYFVVRGHFQRPVKDTASEIQKNPAPTLSLTQHREFESESRASISDSVTVFSAPTDRSAEIKGRITLEGTPPPELELPLDPLCSQLQTNKLTTRHYVVNAQSSLADVFVYIKQGLNRQSFAPPAQPVLLNQVGCEYKPYILGLQTGQKLLVRNSDPFIHNVRCLPMVVGNKGLDLDLAQLPGSKDLEFIFPETEMFIQFRCGPHFWMFAYACVIDHLFFAVSDKDGTFNLSKVPVGKYTIEAYHRKAGRETREVTIAKGESVIADFVFKLPR